MALVVETGAGLANADSYVSVDDFKAWCGRVGYDISTYTDAVIEARLRLAAYVVDGIGLEANRWPGTRKTAVQRLAWPRTNARFQDGTAISSDSVPPQVVDAQCQVGYRLLVDPTLATASGSGDAPVKKRKVGEIEIEYAVAEVQRGLRPTLRLVEDILGGILTEIVTATATDAQAQVGVWLPRS